MVFVLVAVGFFPSSWFLSFALRFPRLRFIIISSSWGSELQRNKWDFYMPKDIPFCTLRCSSFLISFLSPSFPSPYNSARNKSHQQAASTVCVRFSKRCCPARISHFLQGRLTRDFDMWRSDQTEIPPREVHVPLCRGATGPRYMYCPPAPLPNSS